MDNIRKILVVCTGNACRSPMAEGFLKKYFSAEDGFEITSAGISTIGGIPPTSAAVQVMSEQDIDISGYLSTAFDEALARAADLILVMSDIHKDFVRGKVLGIDNKIFLYKEFAGAICTNKNIDDPISQPIAVYRNVCGEIRDLTEEIVKRIRSSR